MHIILILNVLNNKDDSNKVQTQYTGRFNSILIHNSVHIINYDLSNPLYGWSSSTIRRFILYKIPRLLSIIVGLIIVVLFVMKFMKTLENKLWIWYLISVIVNAQINIIQFYSNIMCIILFFNFRKSYERPLHDLFLSNNNLNYNNDDWLLLTYS